MVEYLHTNIQPHVSSINVFFVVMNRDRQTFAATRPSAVLLEQLAVCVDKGEPVLLVGETGTGKTSTVQHLARVTGEPQVEVTRL